jgi:alkylation response protein AidB-like acyl-CoA dehydrogenase
MFALSKSQLEIQKAARDFAKGEFDKDLACELEKRGEFPRDIWKKAADLGFIGLDFPEVLSGGGMGLLESVLVAEAFCRKDSSIGSALTTAASAAELLLRFGSDELKQRYIPNVAEGKLMGGVAISETGRGGDYREIKTTAARRDGGWVINGAKTYVQNGGDPDCGFLGVLCCTDPTAKTPETALSWILVESDRPGLTVGRVGKKLGGNMTATATVGFKDVHVPAANLIGVEGKGFDQLLVFFDECRILTAAQAIGNAQGSFDRMLDYVKGREQFGRKIAEFQVSQHKIADMATRLELARLVTYKAAWLRDQKKTDRGLCSMAKLTATRTALAVGAQTIQLYGGYGFMTEYEVERYYRDAKVLELSVGTRDVQKDLIAANVIGKIK